VRLEAQHARRQRAVPGLVDEQREHRLVAAVDAVEVADRERAARSAAAIELALDAHDARLSDCRQVPAAARPPRQVASICGLPSPGRQDRLAGSAFAAESGEPEPWAQCPTATEPSSSRKQEAMKAVFIISPRYDYLTATLVEGLQELGHEIVSSEDSNYAKKSSDRQIRKHAENADLLVVGSNKKVRSWLVEDIPHPVKVFVDGSDWQDFIVCPDMLFKVVFKRELNARWTNPLAEPIFPLPFAAERRYFQAGNLPRDISVSFAARMNNNPMRHSIYQRLINRRDDAVFAGGTGESSYSSRKPKGLPFETPKYRQLLHRSRIAVNVAGAGYDCGRFWEIAAAGAMILTQELDICIPSPFVDGEHCVVFRSLDEFEQKLEWLLSNPLEAERIASRGHDHLLAKHTTRERASTSWMSSRIASGVTHTATVSSPGGATDSSFGNC
jgi:hypothetical protein